MITFVLTAATLILVSGLLRMTLDHFACRWYRQRAEAIEMSTSEAGADFCEAFHHAMTSHPKPLYVRINDRLEDYHV
jgi:hypothetical protein